MDWSSAVIGALLSGLLATVINIMYNICRDKKVAVDKKKQHKRDYKMHVFCDLIGYRGQITLNGVGKEMEVAANQIFIAFQDSKNVLETFKDFHEKTLIPISSIPEKDKDEPQASYDARILEIHVKNQHREEQVINSLLSLLKAMCNDLEIDYSFMNDDLFKRPLSLGSYPRIVCTNLFQINDTNRN